MNEISIFKITHLHIQSPHEQAQASTGTNWLLQEQSCQVLWSRDTGASCLTACDGF